jgi:hypothetical protein
VVETPVSQGPWGSFDALSTDRWDIALTNNNGEYWEGYLASKTGNEDNILGDCYDYDPIDHRLRIKFTAQDGDLWKIRVNDEDGAFSDNTGNMAYKFYVLCEGMACTGSVPNDSTTNGIPAISIQGAGNVCSIAVMRPGSLTLSEIGGLGNYFGAWVQYANLSILRYMAWCPKHTNLFLTYLNKFKTREPLATIAEWDETLDRMKQEIESYDWGENGNQETSIFDEGGGDFTDTVEEKIYGDTSVWDGGNIVSFSGSSLPSSYYSCESAFVNTLPTRLKSGVCFVSAYFIETSASFWIQLTIDIGSIFLLLGMIKGAVQEAVYMMTGVKPWTANRQDIYPTIRAELYKKGDR